MNDTLEFLRRDIRTIGDDIADLFDNRRVAKRTLEIAKQSTLFNEQPFYPNWIAELWARDAMIGIRRQTDANARSTSLYNVIVRVRDCSGAVQSGLYGYLGKSDGGKDVAKLASLDPRIRKYVNKRIAHCDIAAVDTIKFMDIDACLDSLGDLLQKYHFIVTGNSLANVESAFQFEWEDVFHVPWIK